MFTVLLLSHRANPNFQFCGFYRTAPAKPTVIINYILFTVENRSEVVQSQEVRWYVHEEGLAYIVFKNAYYVTGMKKTTSECEIERKELHSVA